MPEHSKNVLIGLFVIAAIVLVGWVLVFLNPSVGDEGKTIRVRFANIDKVNVGTRVTYAGQPVGEVVAIEPIALSREETLKRPGPLYSYELTLAIDSNVIVYESDQFAIHTSGLLGERSIAIVPKRPIGNQPLVELSDQVMHSSPGASVEETFSGLSSLARKAEEVLGQMSEILEASGGDFHDTLLAIKEGFNAFDTTLSTAEEVQLVSTLQEGAELLARSLEKLRDGPFFDNVSAISSDLKEITGALNQPDSLKAIVDNTKELSANIADISTKVSEKWGTVDQTVDDFAATAANIRQLSEDMTEGEGTLSKLLTDDALYLQARSIMSKVETLMDDVNHYGMLFHLDRGWQRQRTRRMNMLAELSSAEQFRNYFEEEVSQINASLTRVSKVLEKTEHDARGRPQRSNAQFNKALMELLRRVETLQETLKRYNEQVTAE